MAILIAGGWATVGAVQKAPALNPAVRAEGADGGWRVPVGAALYDSGAYLYQLGYAHLFGDLPEGISGAALTDALLVRAQTAGDIFRDGLSLAPADAYLWTGLAWAEAMENGPELSARALRRSFALAPYSAELGPERLIILESLMQNGSPSPVVDPGLLCEYLQLAGRWYTVDPDRFAAAVPLIVESCTPT